jgi:tRNA-specific 2-thiouridylase
MRINSISNLEQYANKSVFVGLSGGVDSSVSAALLQQAGADVTGVFMKNWAGERGLQIDCPWQEDLDSARAAANHLGINFAVVNFEQEYKQYVLDYFFAEYKAGRTPNPDILCNSEIKFKAFLDWALDKGADYIATGHYAGKKKINGIERLIRPRDKNKDQTYFLSNLSAAQLNRAVFPLQDLTKVEVRKVAKKLELPNHQRKDSQGICFIGDLDVSEFLRKYIDCQVGEIVDEDSGEVIGKHSGVAFYTIGQRQGLGIGGADKPYYVSSKDAKRNIIYAVQGRGNKKLCKHEILVENTHLINKKADYTELEKFPLTAAIRYRQVPQRGQYDSRKKRFVFTEGQWAPSPGQSLVYYSGNICLGRSIIK